MKIGFSGTQSGMKEKQHGAVRRLLRLLRPTELHHGDCVGADAEAHHLAFSVGGGLIETHVHPPENDAKRAYLDGNFEYPPLPYLERNQAIVDATEALIAAPATADEQLRSGTWSTVRRAKKAGKAVFVVEPSGSVKLYLGD